MEEKAPPDPEDWHTRAGRRRLGRYYNERRDRIRAERARFLQTQLEPGEQIVARSADHPLVTDRRIISAHQRGTPPRQGEWICESVALSQITRWTLCRQHDHRPLLWLEHAPVKGLEHAPAHRFLWFEWGNAEEPVDRTDTVLGFGRDSNPVLRALIAALERESIPKGQPFVVGPVDMPETKTRQNRAPLLPMSENRRVRWSRRLSRRETPFP